MRKIFLIIMFIFMMVGTVSADFLAADNPTFTPLVCEVEVNGTPQAANCIVDGNQIKFINLTGFAPGPYTFKARWKIKVDGQWSEWSLPFVDEKPEKPGGLKVVK